MKKIDTRGFIMVETIVVAVFVIGICTFLFANFLPLMGDYERISDYDMLSSKYKVHEIRKMILKDLNNNSEIASLFTSIPSDKGYDRYSNYIEEVEGKTIIKNRLCDNLNSKNYCNKLLGKDYLDIKEIYITYFKLTKIKGSIKNLSGDGTRPIKEYIEYLPSYSNYSSRYNDYYRLIVLFNDGKLANIEVHYEIG